MFGSSAEQTCENQECQQLPKPHCSEALAEGEQSVCIVWLGIHKHLGQCPPTTFCLESPEVFLGLAAQPSSCLLQSPLSPQVSPSKHCYLQLENPIRRNARISEDFQISVSGKASWMTQGSLQCPSCVHQPYCYERTAVVVWLGWAVPGTHTFLKNHS